MITAVPTLQTVHIRVNDAATGQPTFVTFDPKAGAVHSLFHLLNDQRLNHRCQIVPGVLARECGEILSQFFQAQRRLGKK